MTLSRLGLAPSRHAAVTVVDLDGSHLDVARDLVRSTLTGDALARDLVVASVGADQAFKSCLDLLLAQAHFVGEADAPCDGGASFLLQMASATGDPATSLFYRQVGMSLMRDPHATKVTVAPISVFALVGLCVTLSLHIAEQHGYLAAQRFFTFAATPSLAS